jgi:hypothetical protein
MLIAPCDHRCPTCGKTPEQQITFGFMATVFLGGALIWLTIAVAFVVIYGLAQRFGFV